MQLDYVGSYKQIMCIMDVLLSFFLFISLRICQYLISVSRMVRAVKCGFVLSKLSINSCYGCLVSSQIFNNLSIFIPNYRFPVC